MVGSEKGSIIEFDGFPFDAGAGVLWQADGSLAPLGSRALAILQLLIERKGQLVSKGEMFDTVWPGVVVEDGNLSLSKYRRCARC